MMIEQWAPEVNHYMKEIPRILVCVFAPSPPLILVSPSQVGLKTDLRKEEDDKFVSEEEVKSCGRRGR